MSRPSRQILHATSLRDVVAAVPFQCGFHPRRSVVVLSLRGPRKRVGLVARMDLPGPHDLPDDIAEVIDELVGFVVRDEGSASMVVVYDDLDWDADRPPDRDVVTPLLAALERSRIPAVDAVYVTAERYWSYRCRDRDCCPAEGQSVADAQASPVAAAYVLAGMAPLADREALAARVQPSRPLLVAAVADSTWRWLGAFAADADAALGRGAPGGGGEARVDELVRQRSTAATALMEDLVADYRSGGSSLGVEAAGQLVAVLQTIGCRDDLVLRFCRTGLPVEQLPEPGVEPDPAVEDAVERLLVDLCVRVEGPLASAPLCLLGWHSWARGEGALARIAVDRALAEDPTYRLARLLSSMLDRAVAPDWVGAMREEDERAS